MNSALILILVTYLHNNIYMEDGSEILGKPRGGESVGLHVALLYRPWRIFLSILLIPSVPDGKRTCALRPSNETPLMA